MPILRISTVEFITHKSYAWSVYLLLKRMKIKLNFSVNKGDPVFAFHQVYYTDSRLIVILISVDKMTFYQDYIGTVELMLSLNSSISSPLVLPVEYFMINSTSESVFTSLYRSFFLNQQNEYTLVSSKKEIQIPSTAIELYSNDTPWRNLDVSCIGTCVALSSISSDSKHTPAFFKSQKNKFVAVIHDPDRPQQDVVTVRFVNGKPVTTSRDIMLDELICAHHENGELVVDEILEMPQEKAACFIM